MKRTLLAAATAALLLFSGCDSQTSGATQDEYSVDPAGIYPFIESIYTLRAERVSGDIEYQYIYYFTEGEIGGAECNITFPDVTAADEFRADIAEDHEYVALNGCTVTFYISDDEDPYWEDYSFDELEHCLIEAGYSIEYNFEKDLYFKEFLLSD